MPVAGGRVVIYMDSLGETPNGQIDCCSTRQYEAKSSMPGMDLHICLLNLLKPVKKYGFHMLVYVYIYYTSFKCIMGLDVW